MEKVKILIVGSNGLLGQKAVQTFRKNYEVVTGGIEVEPFANHDLAYHHLDITDWRSLQKKIVKIDPRIIFNAAAYTQVDRAETERELCYAVNVTGVKNLAKICKAQDAELIHISTDYVFDGVKGNYKETDEPNPLGYYGQTKWEGEKAVQDVGCRAIIARTAVLFGYGVKIQANFALWVIRELEAKRPIRVVDDQIGNSTIAENLAAALAALAEKNARGLFHVAGCEPVSRYNFAVAIALQFGFATQLITRICSKDFPQQAPRPMDASLNVDKTQKEYGVKLFTVAESLRLLQENLDL